MNYSTFNKNTFFIKKNSTLPELKFPLTQQIREKYDITDDMLENIGVTFSMIDENGLYRIANVPASLVINNDRVKFPDEEKYTLVYRFKESQTNKAGNYNSEFIVNFLQPIGCGSVKFPINGYINIVISDSITKSSVI